MRQRSFSPALIVLLAGISSPAMAMTCLEYEEAYQVRPPECMTEGGSSMYITRVNQPCPTADADLDGVDIMFPDPATLGPDDKFTPVILIHGGGVAPGHRDVDVPQSHWTNPYWNLSSNLLIAARVAVFQPILPNLQNKPSLDAAMDITAAVKCLADRTDANCTTGCLSELVGRVKWGTNDYTNTVYVAHSAGGVAGLYIPELLQSGLAGLILIDPAKDGVLTPPSNMYMTAPLIHLYPDWQGPFNNATNNLFDLGSASFFTGPWVPIGLRDYTEGASCDPDANCHPSNHCTALSDTTWFNSPPGDLSHAAYCANNNTTSACTSQANNRCAGDPSCISSNWPSDNLGYCSTSGGYCGQRTKCTRNGAVNPGWLNFSPTGTVTSRSMLHRYVVAYAGCLAGVGGGKMQSWVNGRHRYFDDVGGSGAECTSNGYPNAACAVHTTGEACTQAGCLWATAMNGSVIRINNGQGVTEYDPHSARFYTSGQGYSSTGTCQGGTRNGQSCVSDAFCGGGSNCTAGDFTERSERLGLAAGAANTINCQ